MNEGSGPDGLERAGHGSELAVDVEHEGVGEPAHAREVPLGALPFRDGDAALASTDDRYELTGVVSSRDGDYRVSSDGLDTHLVPKKPPDISAESLHRTQRGIAYTKQAFAYLFTRVR